MQIPYLLLHQIPVSFGAAISEELPDVSNFLNLVEIQVRDDNFFAIARPFGQEFSTGSAEIALTIKLSNIPRLLAADSVNGADEIAVRDGVGGLFQFPQILAETGDCGGRIEHDLRAIQPKSASAFREVTVVADIDSDVCVFGLEH